MLNTRLSPAGHLYNKLDNKLEGFLEIIGEMLGSEDVCRLLAVTPTSQKVYYYLLNHILNHSLIHTYKEIRQDEQNALDDLMATYPNKTTNGLSQSLNFNPEMAADGIANFLNKAPYSAQYTQCWLSLYQKFKPQGRCPIPQTLFLALHNPHQHKQFLDLLLKVTSAPTAPISLSKDYFSSIIVDHNNDVIQALQERGDISLCVNAIRIFYTELRRPGYSHHWLQLAATTLVTNAVYTCIGLYIGSFFDKHMSFLNLLLLFNILMCVIVAIGGFCVIINDCVMGNPGDEAQKSCKEILVGRALGLLRGLLIILMSPFAYFGMLILTFVFTCMAFLAFIREGELLTFAPSAADLLVDREGSSMSFEEIQSLQNHLPRNISAALRHHPIWNEGHFDATAADTENQYSALGANP